MVVPLTFCCVFRVRCVKSKAPTARTSGWDRTAGGRSHLPDVCANSEQADAPPSKNGGHGRNTQTQTRLYSEMYAERNRTSGFIIVRNSSAAARSIDVGRPTLMGTFSQILWCSKLVKATPGLRTGDVTGAGGDRHETGRAFAPCPKISRQGAPSCCSAYRMINIA